MRKADMCQGGYRGCGGGGREVKSITGGVQLCNLFYYVFGV